MVQKRVLRGSCLIRVDDGGQINENQSDMYIPSFFSIIIFKMKCKT